MIIIIVDLPEPEGPTTLTVSPGAMASDMPRRTLTAPAALASVRCTSSRRTMLSERDGLIMPELFEQGLTVAQGGRDLVDMAMRRGLSTRRAFRASACDTI